MEKIDKKRATFDCGVKASFEQDLESRLSISDEDNINCKLEYFGTIQDIIKVDFRKFDMFIFDVRWFKVVTQGQQSTIRRDKSGLIQVDSTKVWTNQRDTFVLPEHCEQIVFKVDPRDPKWLFVIEVAPRKRQIFEGVEVQELLDELTLPNDGSDFVDVQNSTNDDEHDGTNEEPQEEQQAYEELHEGILIELQESMSRLSNDEGPFEEDMEDELEKDEDLEMDGPELQLQLEGDSSDDDEVSPIDNEDGEIFLEIDLFGMRDLREDDFIDEEL